MGPLPKKIITGVGNTIFEVESAGAHGPRYFLQALPEAAFFRGSKLRQRRGWSAPGLVGSNDAALIFSATIFAYELLERVCEGLSGRPWERNDHVLEKAETPDYMRVCRARDIGFGYELQWILRRSDAHRSFRGPAGSECSTQSNLANVSDWHL
jgi:hypothetical protein